jgi:hypothetical protein
MKQEEDKWVAKIRDGNYVYIHSNSGSRQYVLTAVRKDIMWKDYGGSRGPERVGIEVGHIWMINIYHHRENTMDVASIKNEIQENRGKKWVCAGDFNCHHSLGDGNGREPAGSWREVKELIEIR